MNKQNFSTLLDSLDYISSQPVFGSMSREQIISSIQADFDEYSEEFLNLPDEEREKQNKFYQDFGHQII